MFGPLEVESWVAGRRKGLQDVRGRVEEIIAAVRGRGDSALIEFARKYDASGMLPLRVEEDEFEAAYEEVEPELVEALLEAEARITRFHELQRPRDLWMQELEPGIVLGEKVTPLDRIGIYVPGRRAAYPSSVLMSAIPAKVAGVREICCCTPPPIHPLTLVALDVVGVKEVYRAGGAQAVAAMALGTASIRKVQKIVGPGNVYVTMAKILLREEAEIDFPAGPSEIGIIADETANPLFIAMDILAQAEHDPEAACILITTSEVLALSVKKDVERLVGGMERGEILRESLERSGYRLVRGMDEAVREMDRIAPEHLSIQVKDPLPVLQRIRHAGAIFIGPYSPVACGDYASGTNHVLPTAGYAQVYSGLDVMHFCKRITIQQLTQEGLEGIAGVVESLAEAEGLQAHAESVRVRIR
ncbi:MAG: histidinol dehydrogenase [Methanomicrobiales archaeon]|nr:histidinol dehydrogenase [Methanomicrobiales archaeon]